MAARPVSETQQAAQANSAGHAAMKAGDAATAEGHFARAVALAPGSPEFRLNRAIALNALGRFAEAVAQLKAVEAAASANPAYCSTRGTAERGAGNKRAAAQWYDRALAADPQRVRALHGRARVALERGEPDALARFDRALAANPGDADLWLGKAQALDVSGDAEGAQTIMQQVVEQAPAWTEGLKFLAQLRLAAGDSDFTAHYAEAARRVPQDPNIPMEWARHLAGLDYNAEAAEVIAAARKTFPQIAQFALLHAIYLAASGEGDAAETLFAGLDLDSEDRWLHEARHAVRRGEIKRTHAALDRALAFNADNIAAWALRDLAWRLEGDTRHEWLHTQQGLVQLVPLRDAEKVLPEAISRLHELHDGSPFPLGQSLRGGTQTRGILFHRHEEEFAALHDAICGSLEDYRAALPDADAEHPLLKHREAPWRIAGSWSVRLAHGGDFHTPHLHPEGIVSSACYLELPDDLGDGDDRDDERAGWIELGRPAPDLRLDLEPLYTLQPKVGHLALFPSTLYHGTRPFGQGRRMTVAFDVTLAERGTP